MAAFSGRHLLWLQKVLVRYGWYGISMRQDYVQDTNGYRIFMVRSADIV